MKKQKRRCVKHDVSVLRFDGTRQKLREARLGRSQTEETRRKISAALKGKAFSEEHCQRISIAKTGCSHLRYRGNSTEVTGCDENLGTFTSD